jgi:hypothetical protein
MLGSWTEQGQIPISVIVFLVNISEITELIKCLATKACYVILFRLLGLIMVIWVVFIAWLFIPQLTFYLLEDVILSAGYGLYWYSYLIVYLDLGGSNTCLSISNFFIKYIIDCAKLSGLGHT